MNYRHSVVSFPVTTLKPGEKDIVQVDDIRTPFRPSKLIISATMNEIRGRFKLKRSRLPLLDRDNIINAYTRVYRCRRGKKVWFRRGRTTVEYGGGWVAGDRWGDQRERRIKPFVRTYLPSSVVYIPTDAAEYIVLQQLSCDDGQQMPGNGVSAAFFGPDVLGNGISLPTTTRHISMHLKNIGDVVVRVQATLFGYTLDQAPTLEEVLQ